MKFIKDYFNQLKKNFDSIPYQDVKEVTDVLYKAYKNDKQIFIIGNGGSAATASHFACDLAKGTVEQLYDKNEKRFRVISLTDNIAHLTAIGNDMNYDQIFSQQIRNLIHPEDILIAITASGNSKNIINAIELASHYGAITIGFIGFDGGKLKSMVDYHIHVPSNNYGHVEDIHLALEHAICAYLREMKKEKQA